MRFVCNTRHHWFAQALTEIRELCVNSVSWHVALSMQIIINKCSIHKSACLCWMVIYFAKLQMYRNTKLTFSFAHVTETSTQTILCLLPVSDINNKLFDRNFPMNRAPYMLFFRPGNPRVYTTHWLCVRNKLDNKSQSYFHKLISKICGQVSLMSLINQFNINKDMIQLL